MTQEETAELMGDGMSYFLCGFPYMSEEELIENGIKIHRDASQIICNKESEGKSMESWEERMINEYREVRDRYEKLHKMLVKYDAGKLEFTPSCPIDLLREQASVMGRYLYILEERACIEGIELV